ncbi:alpha/beta hydrolase [Nocardioides flavus (ex Wang et al. 2016)]|uniref:Alpha/beta hydrolase n=1 Tax=Nocardioides flavus (ex Wang et al. 2016) TaxID=2058780 RepID=A0ABQ3HM48_9ACTN|nr:alpha/beta fold hydrolase [Nocardioides flavus (ex Wang et al. 2016)]GHE18611.1 alpha/beta hydrolase [Nocardioides flavus (ex Wang et al. 2016)]
MTDPLLTRHDPVAGPARALVLVLHGGKPRSTQSVDGRSASWRRALWLQREITDEAHAAGVGVWSARYRTRGWNGGGAPTADARWALEQVRTELGEVPVVLLGHSMGARVAVHVADDPSVVGVVGLAPWWSSDDPVHTLAGRTLRAAHGRRDRITSFRETARYVDRAREVADSADLRDMGGLGHYMLAGSRRWHDVAISSCLEVLDAHVPHHRR